MIIVYIHIHDMLTFVKYNIIALGIVVARRKQILLGREITDPRRILMLASMWFEIVGFSYLPCQLLYYEYTGGKFGAQTSGHVQVCVVCYINSHLLYHICFCT